MNDESFTSSNGVKSDDGILNITWNISGLSHFSKICEDKNSKFEWIPTIRMHFLFCYCKQYSAIHCKDWFLYRNL